jgi:MFS family permease
MGSALWAGIFLSSLRAHALVGRHGHARVFVGASGAAALAMLSLLPHASYAGWVAGAFALGLAGGLVWVSGEAWLAEAAPAGRRGFYVGLFETSVGLGMVAGPALVPLALTLGGNPLALGAALVGAAAVLSVRLLALPGPGQATEAAQQHDSAPAAAAAAREAWRTVAAPLAGIAVVGGLMESGISAILPSISMRLGFDVATAAALGAVIGAGSALLQSPFGWLADRLRLPRAMALAWALIALATLVLLAAALAGAAWPTPVLWGVGFVLGGVGGAVYTLVVIELGHRLRGAGLVRAMGLLVTAYTVGTAAGPALGGALFDATGLRGLAAALALLALLGGAAAWRALGAPAAGRPPADTPR